MERAETIPERSRGTLDTTVFQGYDNGEAYSYKEGVDFEGSMDKLYSAAQKHARENGLKVRSRRDNENGAIHLQFVPNPEADNGETAA